MSDITNKDLEDIIRETLGMHDNSERLDESFVAQEKQFSLTTELLSSAAKKSHIELYKGYVESFNEVSAQLDTANRSESNSSDSTFRSLKIDEVYDLNAIYLHELYFSNISDLHSQIGMDSLSYMRLARDFGTFDDWQKDFIACCMASRCGWAVTGYSMYLQSYINCVIDLHDIHVPIGFQPIIVMDLWQHAYYRDYLNDVKTYVFGMMKQINWDVIEERVQKIDRIEKALKR